MLDIFNTIAKQYYKMHTFLKDEYLNIILTVVYLMLQLKLKYILKFKVILKL